MFVGKPQGEGFNVSFYRPFFLLELLGNFWSTSVIAAEITLFENYHMYDTSLSVRIDLFEDTINMD